MKAAILNHMRQPTTLGQAYAAIAITSLGTVNVIFLAHRELNKYREVIETQNESLAIYSEATKVLMDRADSETLAILDKNLDYWRIVFGDRLNGE